MQKRYLFMFLPLLVLILAGTSYAWQGRMDGMGGPYGLVSDESDFLIHPAKIAGGEGTRFYGGYRFTYTGVLDWGYERIEFPLTIPVVWRTERHYSGDEQQHEAHVGTAFPLGPGRMGLFFTYDGQRGDYEWEDINEFVELADDLDAFALRILYGLPMGDLRLGGEVQFAYRQEKHEMYEDFQIFAWVNSGFEIIDFLPYDSEYWEALLKGSLEGAVGPADVECTIRGGFIFGGDNEWEYEFQSPPGNPINGGDLDGTVEGWQIGGDLWVRYPVDALTLPFLVRIDYQEKARDGDGVPWDDPTVFLDYENVEHDFQVVVGGGVDKEFGTGTRVAAGIYYQYLNDTNDFYFFSFSAGPGIWRTVDETWPDRTEHQVMVRLVGEREYSPTVALRAGFNVLYGWVRWEQNYLDIYSTGVDWAIREGRYAGHHWGIAASVGGTIVFSLFTLEPFISGGYQQYDLDGDGEETGTMNPGFWEMDLTRQEWFVAGGLSVLFGL